MGDPPQRERERERERDGEREGKWHLPRAPLPLSRWAFHNKLIPRHSSIPPPFRPSILSLSLSPSLLCSFVNKNSQKHSLLHSSAADVSSIPRPRGRQARGRSPPSLPARLPLPSSGVRLANLILDSSGRKGDFLVVLSAVAAASLFLSLGIGEIRGIF